MKSETKTCQNCRNQFIIEPEDFDFYRKIQVPAPTWCSECRLIRRMIQMNDKVLYKKQCQLCGKSIITVFSPDNRIPTYCNSCWWSDKWDALDYGRDYDFSQPFFERFSELLGVVPWPALHRVESTMENSDYCSVTSYLKNCYLVFNSDYNKDSAYATFLEQSQNVFDIFMAGLCELCYECSNVHKCSRVFYSSNCNDCIDVWFSRNLRNCSYCFGCFNLRHKQYCIFNKQLSKDGYFEKIKQFDTGSYVQLEKYRKQAESLSPDYPRKHMEGFHNVNVSGNYIFNSKNVHNGYEIGSSENVKHSQFLFVFPTHDSYDLTMWGGDATHMYECMGCGGGQYNIRFCYECWCGNTENLSYSVGIVSSGNNLFGCVNLKNKSYCILNKQYTKEEYEKLVPRIISHMNEMPYVDARGKVYKYGEFFPPELSPFAYDETIAQEYFPLTKEQALEKGYRWKDPEERRYEITVKAENLSDHIKDVEDTILKETIGCAHEGKCNEQCTTAFKIVPQELSFYRRLNLPLPRLCPNCRHYGRLKKRNPLKLWHRQCMCDYKVYQNTTKHTHHSEGRCPNEFETSYAPERPEIVYCEQCYNSEVV